MNKSNLDIIIGRMIDSYPLLEQNSIQTCSEIMNLRVKELVTRVERISDGIKSKISHEQYRMAFFTANLPIYTVEGDEAVIYLGERKAFNTVIGKNIDDFVSQIKRTGNYKVNKKDLNWVKSESNNGNSREIERYVLSNLDLTPYIRNQSYFDIETSKFSSLNEDQRRFAQQVFGKEDCFEDNMKLLSTNGAKRIRVYLLNPNSVKRLTGEDMAIARASWLNSSFYKSANFAADFWEIGNNRGAFLGYLKEIE